MNHIILECKPDEEFIRALGFSRKQIIHQPNKGAVINFLRKNPGLVCVGIMDEDPGTTQPKHLKEFVFNRELSEHNFSVFESKRTSHLIIMIKPRLEDWILDIAKKNQVVPGEFSLPEEPKQLHKVINFQLIKFSEMVLEMLSKKSSALIALKKIINQQFKK